MSKAKVGSSASLKDSETNIKCWQDNSATPDFIYGGPFVTLEKPAPLLDTATPINIQLQGTFKKSFAYYSLKERLPVILTKVIDYISREGAKIKAKNKASDEDLNNLVQYIAKLKNELVTNKKYALLTVDTPEAKRWNEWIQNSENSYYFTNTWVFTECYVYRRLREGAELQKGLQDFDPFDEQKEKSFANSLEPMCIVAEKLLTMLPEGEKDQKKADFVTLVKICLWANKCDLSLSLGEQVTLKGAEGPKPPEPAKGAEAAKGGGGAADAKSKTSLVDTTVIDPFQMIIDFKDKVLIDDSNKAWDQINTKTEAIAKAIEGNTSFKYQCSCHRLATLAAMPLCKEEEAKPPDVSASKAALAPPAAPPAPAPPAPAEGAEGEEPPKIPCPAKMVIPQAVMFDIVCDNAGYELFADLCLAHFFIAQKIVQKVRFHVKKIPWFVSDVTPADFKYTIEQCRVASYNREVPPEPKEPPAEGEAPPEPDPPRIITAESLHTLGDQWQAFVDDGTFIVLTDDYWTAPHTYKDMKKYQYNLYRKLQFAAAIMFKGDLNYRKLLGERNCNPVLGFEPSLQGFLPAPILAVRTVKADLICGLPKGKFEQLNKLDDKWMQKGDYGVIQFCGKTEPFKIADRPCFDYGQECRGTGCPIHGDL